MYTSLWMPSLKLSPAVQLLLPADSPWRFTMDPWINALNSLRSRRDGRLVALKLNWFFMGHEDVGSKKKHSDIGNVWKCAFLRSARADML